MARAAKNPDEIGAAAADYLRLFGLVASGWMWIAHGDDRRDEGRASGGAAASKLATAEFFVSEAACRKRSRSRRGSRPARRR